MSGIEEGEAAAATQTEANGTINAAEAALQPNNVTETPIPPQPETPEEEKQIIKDLEAKANLEGFKAGDTYYIVSTNWYKRWKDYVRYDWYSSNALARSGKPGPIDNDNIIEPGSPVGDERIRKSAMENYDFVIMSSDCWRTLHHWYGGGPALPRKVIATGWNNSNLQVEIRPLALKVCKSSAINDFLNVSFSKTDTIADLKRVMCERLGLNVDDVRVWDFYNMSKYKMLEDLKQRLDSAQIIEGQAILLEEKDANGKFPEIPKAKTGYSSYSSYYNSGGPTDPGTTGLINLGNTCFMNSAIQCLSNAAPLTTYFTSDQYKTDVNTDNPLGMKGELAEEWASLVKELWSGSHSAVAPRDFKWKLERFAPQFAGYQQHDSQELLAFLLDGLHEDLNRVRQKPYTENPEVGEQDEQVVAREAWATHKKRNNSIIVDWFQGQLKSTLVCPKCNRVSKTFDPFMYLSLPLPMKMTRLITVTLFFKDGFKKPIRYGCEVSKAASIKELKKVLSGQSGVPAESLILCDVYNSRFFKSFPDNEGVDGIQDRDFICAYETLVPASDSEDIMYFPVIHRKEEVMGYHSVHNFSRKTLFGYPFVLSIPDASKITYKQLYDLIYLQIQRFLKLPKGRVYRSTDDIPDEWADTAPTSSHAGVADDKTTPAQTQQGYFVEREDSDFSTDSEADEKKSDDEGEQEMTTRKKVKRSQPLFTIRTVDNYGMTDHEVLVDNDKPLRLDSRETLAVNWTDEIHDLIYDESVEKDFEYDPSYRKQQSNSQEREQEQSVSLQSCIDMFTTVEKLGPEDPWYCSKCQEFQQATKKFDLWKLPPVLVVHLKRFSYKNRYWREKLETFVDYPIHDFDLSSIAQGPQEVPPVYELFAVSNHYGSLGGGHYTAYAKNKNDGKWYKFDDSSVSPVEESRVKTSSGYVLFYQRKDTIQQPQSSSSTTSGNNNNAEPMEVTTQNTSQTDSMDDVDP